MCEAPSTAMISLNSSALRGADYDPATRQMHIWFHGRGTYTFYRVPQTVFDGLINAASHGCYYNDRIRGRYGP